MSYKPINLIEETQRLLSETEQKRSEIAVGAGVGVEWLNKLAQGRATNPRYKPLSRVYEYLQSQAEKHP